MSLLELVLKLFLDVIDTAHASVLFMWLAVLNSDTADVVNVLKLLILTLYMVYIEC